MPGGGEGYLLGRPSVVGAQDEAFNKAVVVRDPAVAQEGVLDGVQGHPAATPHNAAKDVVRVLALGPV